ncbi:flavodoxin family protein [Dictyobacter kobayashii]|uniref:Flavodoxin n=1 Tax=Dictyobacter kobayashii TaxID=2014872 RepID=A0A402AR77_9CHLR|nr:flavodoxin family protein [Dictyobacter kobayashii]GCE21601.1 flavodoxin [Dictyobacter kobayashii]
MNTLIIYDSMYGNTEKIAYAMADGITGDVKVQSVVDVNAAEFSVPDLLIVGSPVHGGRPTVAIEEFLKQLPADALKGISVAAFDTRFSAEDHGIGIRLLISIIHYAAGRIAKVLTRKGGRLIAEPEGFIVEDKEGPLQHGELERATSWAKELCAQKESLIDNPSLV